MGRRGEMLLATRATKVATVALANKTARMAWKIMTSGERYREPLVQPANVDFAVRTTMFVSLF
jgi:hypothetical protein